MAVTRFAKTGQIVMSGNSTQSEMMDRLAEAAWKELATTSPRHIHIDDVAAAADIPAAAARAGSSPVVLGRLATCVCIAR